ncbi:MAG: CinA family nicotinamide mononucleotide deamidase-related protein [Phycisphaerales bacterium]
MARARTTTKRARAASTPHRRAAVLSTGDEIILGQITDTNAGLISQELALLGILPTEHNAVGDQLETLATAIARLADRNDLLIMTGGLGPTDGDLTRAALGRVLGCSEVDDQNAAEWLAEWAKIRGRTLTGRQMRQTRRPALATCLRNHHGTAPGLHAVVKAKGRRCDIYALPGPPSELKPMLAEQVLPALRPAQDQRIVTRLLHAIGLGEAEAVDRMGDLTSRTRMPLVGITASAGVLTIRIRYEGPLALKPAEKAVAAAARQVRRALGHHVFGEGSQTLAGAALDRLAEAHQSLAVVESCTGGLLGAMLTEEPGASRAFVGGWLTYSNEMKAAEVGVPTKTLTTHGAVSAATAESMAQGGMNRSGATHALAITGVAGPGGGSESKPVGTVFIALATRSGPCRVQRFIFPGGRSDIRTRAARAAIGMLYGHLAGLSGG